MGAELKRIGDQLDDDRAAIARPNWWLRGFIISFIAVVFGALLYGLLAFEWVDDEPRTLEQLLPLIESGLNDIVLIGAAIIFLVSIENRMRRRRVIGAIHHLRALAHVIDMHQLTKDPSVLVGKGENSTSHSPKRDMSAYDIGRYLDYCSELLSLTSKLGFVYVQDFDDPQAVAAVTELENLTTGLSRKIWQKIMLVQEHDTST